MKLELGGGPADRRRGGDWLNVDRVEGADVCCDLECEPLPFAGDSVEAVYSSHCLEHLSDPARVLREVARVCRVGAAVEIRVPHHLNPQALCPGHRCVLSEAQWRQWCVEFLADHWAGCAKRLRLDRIERVRGADYDELAALAPRWREDQILRFLPGACHEIRVFLTVIPHTEGV